MNVRAYPRRVDWMALTMGFGATDTTGQSDTFTESQVSNFGSRAPRSSFLKAASHLTFGWLAGGSASAMTMYRVTDRLHQGRTVAVPGHEIAPTVSAWLAELGVESPLAEELARAACAGDWPGAYAVGEHLSVEVTLADAA